MYTYYHRVQGVVIHKFCPSSVCACAQSAGAAARESLRRDHPASSSWRLRYTLAAAPSLSACGCHSNQYRLNVYALLCVIICAYLLTNVSCVSQPPVASNENLFQLFSVRECACARRPCKVWRLRRLRSTLAAAPGLLAYALVTKQ